MTKVAEKPRPGAIAQDDLVVGSSLFKDAMRRFLRNRLAVVCLVITVLSGVICMIPHLPGMPTSITEAHIITNHGQNNLGPSSEHWFGTDELGRDLFARVVYGGGISFQVAFLGTMVSLIIGVTYGAFAGYLGGRIDNLMMRFVDILYGLPFMFVVILIMTVVKKETNSMIPIFMALGLVQWLTMARIARGQVLSLREQEFVTAARTIGASTPRIIFLHIIPNLLGPIIVYTTLTIPGTMLQESFLSFLGLGIREPHCSWGSLASQGIQAVSPIASYWWQVLFPCGALALTLFSLNFVGDGLRDALDPKGRQ
ncbi:MAG: ABC transporter permease [Planctomycetota bacterium]|nr:ABC transporter permease [Planctomycetota bacterium]